MARWYDPTIGRFNQPDVNIPGTQGVQAWDRYAYVNNNPLLYTDPSGNWIETAFDLISLGMTLNDIRNEGLTVMNAISLVTDVASVVLPIVPAGVSHALRAAKIANKLANTADTVADTAKLANKLDNIGDTAKNIVKKVDDFAPSCRVNSFSADTDVATLEGAKDIATIEIGDYVLAWNETDNSLGFYPVTATIHHTDKVIVNLILDGEWIETTPEHPFYVEGKGWKNAEDLGTGDQVRQADGTTGTVWLQWNVHKTQEMYNLTVDTAHTFFVGQGQWLVHNCADDKFITLYHGSVDNSKKIFKNGLDDRPGATYVSDSLEAAQDAINYRKQNFHHEVTDPGIIVSQVPRALLNRLDNGRDILSRPYSGFYPYTLNATEYLLRSTTAKKLFNFGIKTLMK